MSEFDYFSRSDDTIRFPSNDDDPADSVGKLISIIRKYILDNEIQELALALLDHIAQNVSQ